MNYGLHIIRNPAGTYSYVGTIPTELATMKPTTRDDVMGGRAFSKDGAVFTWKFPVFNTRQAAIQHAAEHGYHVK